MTVPSSTGAQRQYIAAWKEHIRPILDHACPVCTALGITPTWGDPVLVARQVRYPSGGDAATFHPGMGTPASYLVQLTCEQTGTVASFDAAAVGLSPARVSHGSVSQLPQLPALAQASGGQDGDTGEG